MKILMVDENEDCLEQLKRYVNQNFPLDDAVAFLDPRHAIDYAKKNSVDSIYTEIDMRQMDGFSLAKRLRCLYPHVEINFVTRTGDYAVDAFQIRANGYLLKPVWTGTDGD